MIKIEDLSVDLDNKSILRDINLEIRKGEFTSIIGPNGAGKSTLLKSILKLLEYNKGEIYFEGQNIKKIATRAYAQKLAFIPQENNIQFDYTVKDIILMGRYPWIDYWGSYGKEDYRILEDLVSKLKLEELINRDFNHLSGGEKQRVLLARAIAQDTDFIFLDETLSFLDINHQIEIMQLLRKINDEQKKTILIVSHNVNLSIEYSDRLLVLKKGQIIVDGRPEQVITEQLLFDVFNIELHIINNPYTQKPNILYTNGQLQ